MKVITFSILKGGTGKTTSAVNTAAALVKKGKRVLLADGSVGTIHQAFGA